MVEPIFNDRWTIWCPDGHTQFKGHYNNIIPFAGLNRNTSDHLWIYYKLQLMQYSTNLASSIELIAFYDLIIAFFYEQPNCIKRNKFGGEGKRGAVARPLNWNRKQKLTSEISNKKWLIKTHGVIIGFDEYSLSVCTLICCPLLCYEKY